MSMQRALTLVLVVALVLTGFLIGRTTSSGGEDDQQAVEDEQEVSEYTCPMHPEIREPEMGTCPICHMDLVPVDDADDGDSDIPSVQMDEDAQRLAGVQNASVQRGPVSDEKRVFGRVDIDEESEVDIAAWTGGRIERLEISARGDEVRRGQLLARIYSPELYSSQRSLVQAVRTKEEAKEAESQRRLRAARSSMESARTELRLLGVDERQIDEIEETRQARETVDIFATASGTIRERFVQAGDYVDTGDTILSLAPLDTVWGQLDIYERDLQRISEGNSVRVRVPALEGEELEGRIDFVSPQVEADRRVAEARVVLPNEDGRLKPGMYLEGYIEIGVDDGDAVSVPRSAVLWTGHRSLVYVYEDEQLDPPGYVPQPVKLGPRLGDRYIIEEGLEGDETVAKRGVFRIDAELQLHSGPSMMSTIHDDADVPIGDDEVVDVPPEGREFDPPIDPEQLPDDKELWYCDMGTVEWAQSEEQDGECPICGMHLSHREASDHDGGDSDDGHDHDHEHDHDHDEEGHHHAH